ncbi:MAG: hypothetical protein FJ303_00660 [Planctomycetes bacterium]|nr:hypothetical protein [Planctomycetota bacterium]
MTHTTRVAVFAVLAVASLFASHWHATEIVQDETSLAMRQFSNDAALPARMHDASQTRQWWPLAWPALALVVGVAMFWDDFERWWTRET